jgi:hypothetical protein
VSINRSLISGVLFCGAVFVSGCGSGSTVTQGGGGGSTTFQGQVVSGSAGVTGAAIQIYTAGNAGNGSAATPMLTRTVTTDGTGMFSIAGDYTCGQSSTGATISGSNQVYIVATGGATGANTSNNGALVMLAALGTCSNLGGASNIDIDEVTTAAAAWALAPFASSATNIGASSTNATGIENAFLDAALLANPTTGVAATLATNLTVETGKLNGLADALASCVNANDTIACSPLFTAATPSGGAMPMDTFTTALNIVKHPGQNVAAVYAVIPNSPPYATTLTNAPNDWTMSLTVTGGGLSQPTALGVDSQDNVWVANFYGPLSAFGPQGVPLSSTGFGVGDLNQSDGLAIDTSGNIWVTSYNASYNPNFAGGAVTEFYGANSTSGTTGSVVMSGGNPGFVDDIYFPYAVAADTNGNIFVANNGNSSATVLTSAGMVYTTPPPNNTFSGYLGMSLGLNAFPDAIAVDANHGFWLPDGDHSVAHISADGVLESNTVCCDASLGVATDATGNVWIANYLGASFSEVGSDGTLLIDRSTIGGLDSPQFVAIDAGQNIWFSNYVVAGGSITEIAGNAGTVTTGTALSPTTGVYGVGGFGLDVPLDEPWGIAPDRSGNVWVSNEGNDSLVMFFGLATPTVTPLQPVPTAP